MSVSLSLIAKKKVVPTRDAGHRLTESARLAQAIAIARRKPIKPNSVHSHARPIRIAPTPPEQQFLLAKMLRGASAALDVMA